MKNNKELKFHRIQAIDLDTGEIVGNGLKAKNEEVIIDTRKVLTDKQKWFLNNSNDFKYISIFCFRYIR